MPDARVIQPRALGVTRVRAPLTSVVRTSHHAADAAVRRVGERDPDARREPVRPAVGERAADRQEADRADGHRDGEPDRDAAGEGRGVHRARILRGRRSRNMQEHPPVPSDARDPTTATAGSPFDDPRSMQILSTEHWSLLATRSLAWNESFSRAGLFLSVVSATAVALALVGQASQFGSQFTAFALVLLPVCLFVGLATFTRLDEVNGEDAIWVAGMNRIRHAYMEIGPGLAPYFISGTTDDPAGLERTFGVHRPGSAMAHWIVTMPGMVAVIDGVLAGL